MSQTRGRNAGYREKANSRQPHHLSKPNFSSRNRTSSQTPSKEPAATASIIKTRSFQFLVNAVGAENIALALDSTLSRVAELTKGERFTPETAFHMETTLGLPHGFFDQPYPALSPELIARLKAPLEFVRTDDELDDDAKTQTGPASAPAPAPAPATPVTQEQLFVADGSSEDAQMPSQKAKNPHSTAKTGRAQLAKQSTGKAAAKAASGRRGAIEATSPQQLSLHDGATVESIRRANLHVLTGRNGSKAKLGLVMGMTGSNMAHRLHGKKRMDEAEANRFTERLGLPAGWLDQPRSEAEIPESVSVLLAPASRARAGSREQAPRAATLDAGALDVSPPTARASETPSATSGSAQAAVVSETQPRSVKTVGASPTNETEQPAAIEPYAVEDDGDRVPARALANADFPPASATSLQGMDGISPIAEALLKTLAGKARTGRLDELTALELLHKAVLL
ncbi:hypothetical protein [Caballeronia zhejiangensis]|uniref:hypothetical protein n=1 Tax=Caballeronia zhejiangensis TaxID=871203 RepID=UPI001EF5C25A|nr:hypothetical protein [Caballeronia zhejiangensis]MCG7400390.1 hypothetical protein [Caballeronia zhejiangensis]